MRAVVLYEQAVEIEREEGPIDLPMKDQTVEVIGTLEGGKIYICKTIGFPWVGTFTLRKENLRIIE